MGKLPDPKSLAPVDQLSVMRAITSGVRAGGHFGPIAAWQMPPRPGFQPAFFAFGSPFDV
jgi:hypothetical protein